jgi:hypothetical protein
MEGVPAEAVLIRVSPKEASMVASAGFAEHGSCYAHSA